MKKIYYIIGILLMTLLAGCSTSSDFSNSLPSPFTYKVDPKLYEKVPADRRESVDRALYEHTLSKEKLDLATLKEELAVETKRAAGYEQNIAKQQYEKASILVTLEKLQAIDRSGLGVKDDNIKDIAELKTEKLEIEADIIRMTAKLDTLRRQIVKLNQKVDTQELKVTQLEEHQGGMQKAVEKPIEPNPSSSEESEDDTSSENTIMEETLK